MPLTPVHELGDDVADPLGGGIDEASAYAPLEVELGGWAVAIHSFSRVPCDWSWAGENVRPQVAWACDPFLELADAAIAEQDPELDYLRSRYRQQFHDAFVVALGALEDRDRTILRLHLVDGMNIDAIGNDLDMNQGGGCGKGGQSPLPVSNGSPHIRIRHCLIGGS